MNPMSTISELDRGLILYVQSSVGKFPQWSLSNSNKSTQLSDSYTSKSSNFLDYGLGSILLNFQDSLNTLNILI